MNKLKTIGGYLILVALIITGFFTVNKSQEILDWWKLKDYEPSVAIANLAANSGMNDNGKKLFYVHDPTLLDKANFSKSCTVGEETIVLGCYISRQSIYLYDVNEEKLSGVEEVTAAHEMLHAAYDRLTTEEKEELSILLRASYEKIDDKRIIDTLNSYKSKGQAVVDNELHSILGTEVADLPKDLEDYYSQFFSDRQKVVKFAQEYAAEFEKLEDQIKEYDNQLTAIQGDITRLEAELNSDKADLQNQKQAIQSLSNDIEAYNAAVPVFNAKVNSYNAKVKQLTAKINEYNSIVAERNKIAVEERSLVEAVDTRVDSL